MTDEKITGEELVDKIKEISIAEFFEKNRHLLGYENSTKALLTVVKEGVENSLDATEEAGVLPDIFVSVKQVGTDRFHVAIEDNGPGIAESKVPVAFAKFLVGSKFHRLRQSRGIQGIGIHGAVLYSQLTTGKPIKVTSSTGKTIHVFELMIDVTKNEPKVISHEVQKNPDKWHGVKVEMELEGKYVEKTQSIPEYLKQTAIANSFANITFDGPDGKLVYKRATEELPRQPKEIKPHPYGVELGILRRMLSTTKAKNLIQFLMTEFSRVGRTSAEQICKLARIESGRKPHELDHLEAERLHKAMQMVKLISPPTNCLSPLGEHLIIEGLKKELSAEHFVAITRPPSVYRGYPFIVECCTGNTEITLEDGTIIPIKEYVKGENRRVLGMDKNLKILPANVLQVHKIPFHHTLYKIKTKTGREIILTHNNELPILLNGRIKWVECEKIKEGQFIAVPRVIKVNGQKPRILSLLDERIVKIYSFDLVGEIVEKAKKKFGSLKRAARAVGINYNRFKGFRRTKNPNRPSLAELNRIIKAIGESFDVGKINKIAIVDNRFYNPVPVKIPTLCAQDLLYLTGLIQSDGYMNRRSWRVSFTNVDEKLLSLFCSKVKKVFGLKCKRCANEVYIDNKTVFTIVKKVIENLPTLEDSLIVAWLKGVVDGDGWVSLKKDGRLKEIGIATADKKFARLVQSMFLRLRILSTITKQRAGGVAFLGERKIVTKKPKYNVRIGDFGNALEFAKKISFRHAERRTKLLRTVSLEIEARGSSDTVPVGGLLHEVRTSLGLRQNDLWFPDQTVRMVEKGRQNLTRKNLQFLVKRLNMFDYPLELNMLAFSDIFWDKVVEIKKLTRREDFVYDLTTETGNFVANNIVIHNCGLAYGGNLPLDKTAKLYRFANKIPLLYHQSGCAITESVAEVDWRRYGFSQSEGQLPVGPLAILVHFVSVWVPFTSEGKQAIANYPEVVKEIKLAVQDAGRELAIYIRHKNKLRERRLRQELFVRYIPELAESLSKLTRKEKEKIIKALEAFIKERGISGKEEAGSGKKA